MAYTVKDMIDKIRQSIKPSVYLNIDTGEIIKRRQLKQLSLEEQKNFIKADEFDLKSLSYPTTEDEKRINNKQALINKTINSPKQSDYLPTNPPLKLKKEIESNLQKEPPTIDSIEALKKRISEIDNKRLDLSDTKSYLLSIIEDTELQVENEADYHNYLKEHEEEISLLISNIEYHVSTQEQLNAQVTQLATILNMGSLSLLQAENLADIIESVGWTPNVE